MTTNLITYTFDSYTRYNLLPSCQSTVNLSYIRHLAITTPEKQARKGQLILPGLRPSLSNAIKLNPHRKNIGYNHAICSILVESTEKDVGASQREWKW
ncbi:hypothetical protein N7447_006462 [Penicillium robsamsonii]|uniref:uncharacterized protein n=1 Tax=Penicillium robsamsonii TaxID=1792511 RepID=UPI002548D48E|nr:uncharacterized protein N7447_006462 [Penicillium robsamsonii]KAJ5824122.1 hypothetical protein N7447_006462 [Penicillium robsamsonii]